jgi:hypothetical protein
VTTGLAVFAIARRMTQQHREWVIRGYVVTFAFVIFRAFVEVLKATRTGSITQQLTAASWFCWSVPLLIPNLILQGRKIFVGWEPLRSHRR